MESSHACISTVCVYAAARAIWHSLLLIIASLNTTKLASGKSQSSQASIQWYSYMVWGRSPVIASCNSTTACSYCKVRCLLVFLVCGANIPAIWMQRTKMYHTCTYWTQCCQSIRGTFVWYICWVQKNNVKSSQAQYYHGVPLRGTKYVTSRCQCVPFVLPSCQCKMRSIPVCWIVSQKGL